jgi:hypothetical protein
VGCLEEVTGRLCRLTGDFRVYINGTSFITWEGLLFSDSLADVRTGED